ncbi:hemicentin-2-like [Girardinichthys multiradiatus]|uniref:hemicentin-2-like n=1 Tax=Girardinichthys multiradiatus TaxID=208333 RepID=UPI001FABC6C9|nr:hemicentin-2-like [Girardinichthys multiradiatus]
MRMGHTLLCRLVFFLFCILRCSYAEVSKPTVTFQPYGPVVYKGEKISLSCLVQEGGGTQWTYEWTEDMKSANWNSSSSSEYYIYNVSGSDRGKYRCRAAGDHQLTEWSDAYRLTVITDKPRASLTAERTTIPAGGSVALSCSVDRSTGWKFDWFRQESESSTAQLIRTNEPGGVLFISEGGVYSCRGGRGDPVFSTETSKNFIVYKTVFKPTVTLQPNGPVVYRGENITLRCEIQGGGGAQWMYEWSSTHRNPPTSSEFRIIRVSESDSGNYWCIPRGNYLKTYWSDVFILIVRSDGATASLTAERTTIPAGGSVALSCSVDRSTDWKFDWFRQESESSTAQPIRTNEPGGVLFISEGGVYSCRGGRGDPVFYTETSNKVSIQKTVPIKPSVIQQPSWSQIFRGERVTLRCEIQGGGGVQWTYEWRPTNRNLLTSNENKITTADSRVYRCRGRGDIFTSTEWGVLRLTVSTDKPQPVLSVSPSWLSPGASVTLSCGGLEHPSAGWRFFWYKMVPKISSSSYSFELLSGSSNGTEQNSYIVHGPTHTAGYVCRAGRGEPAFYTEYSEAKFVWSQDSHPAASLSVNPDRVQHFIDQSVTLSCSGNNTMWRVRRFTETASPSYIQCSNWGTLSGSSCTINQLWNHSGVSWCESGSGDFSNAVNITVQDDYSAPILVSPVHPVTEGDPVTLSCRDKELKLLSNMFFYHNNKLLHNDSREELKISAVSKSDEGFYKCKHSGNESLQSWMSVRVTMSSPVSSSFPVPLIVGPVSGIILIILLLLLWRYRRFKDLCIRRISSESSSQSSTRDHGVNQRDSQVYSSLLHGDTSEYESIQPATNNGNPDDPEKDAVYTNI